MVHASWFFVIHYVAGPTAVNLWLMAFTVFDLGSCLLLLFPSVIIEGLSILAVFSLVLDGSLFQHACSVLLYFGLLFLQLV